MRQCLAAVPVAHPKAVSQHPLFIQAPRQATTPPARAAACGTANMLEGWILGAATPRVPTSFSQWNKHTQHTATLTKLSSVRVVMTSPTASSSSNMATVQMMLLVACISWVASPATATLAYTQCSWFNNDSCHCNWESRHQHWQQHQCGCGGELRGCAGSSRRCVCDRTQASG